MAGAPFQDLSRAERVRLVAGALLRAALIAVGLLAVYYLAPLDQLSGVPLAVSLVVGLIVLTAATAYEVRAIIRARLPAVRAIQAVAAIVPLFLLLFAATYFLMAEADAGNFNTHALSRTDALYFTVTVFSTVGFGDITATSQVARVIVIVQMLLDLIVIGVVIRVFLGAVQRGRGRRDMTQAGDPIT